MRVGGVRGVMQTRMTYSGEDESVSQWRGLVSRTQMEWAKSVTCHRGEHIGMEREGGFGRMRERCVMASLLESAGGRRTWRTEASLFFRV